MTVVTRCLASSMSGRYGTALAMGSPASMLMLGSTADVATVCRITCTMGSATKHRVIVGQTSASLCLSVTCLTSSMPQELVTKKMELAEINEECLKTRHDLLWEQQKCSALESKLAKTENIVYAKSSANPLSSFNPSRLFH